VQDHYLYVLQQDFSLIAASPESPRGLGDRDGKKEQERGQDNLLHDEDDDDSEKSLAKKVRTRLAKMNASSKKMDDSGGDKSGGSKGINSNEVCLNKTEKDLLWSVGYLILFSC
jgi:hypothetical protein